MKLNDVYNIVNYIARKNIAGNTFTIEQFNDLLKYVPVEFVKNHIQNYETTLNSSSLFSYYRTSTLGFNVIAKPADYWRLSSIKYITPKQENKVAVIAFKSMLPSYDGVIYLPRIKGEVISAQVFTQLSETSTTKRIVDNITISSSIYSGTCSISGTSIVIGEAYDIYVYYKNYSEIEEPRFVSYVNIADETFDIGAVIGVNILSTNQKNIEICGIEVDGMNYSDLEITISETGINCTNVGTGGISIPVTFKILYFADEQNKTKTVSGVITPDNKYQTLLVFDKSKSNTGLIKFSDISINNRNYVLQYDNGADVSKSEKFLSEREIELLVDNHIGNSSNSDVCYKNIKAKETSTDFSTMPNNLSYPVKLTYLRRQNTPFADYVILDTDEPLILEANSTLTKITGTTSNYSYSIGNTISIITLITEIGETKNSRTVELDIPTDFIYEVISLILSKIGISLQRQDIEQYAMINTKKDE